MTFWINEEPLEHRSHNGTVFKAARCDLRSGVEVSKPERITEADLGADFAEFAAWHTHSIWEQVNGFPGWSGVSYTIVIDQTKIELSPGIELAQIDGISSIEEEDEEIRIVFADGLEVRVCRDRFNPDKFDIHTPNLVNSEITSGGIEVYLDGEVVVERVNELAVKAANRSNNSEPQTVSLFALFSAADSIILGGYEVETINYVDGGCRVEYCGGDEKAFFLDQPVALVDGGCTAVTANDPEFSTDAPKEYELAFLVAHMLQPADLA